jgi:predicted histidine transporter YuiF (NhaC family)
MSVGYFDFYEDGTHTIKVTNISKNQINLQVEFGNTESQEMTLAGILILAGAVTMIVISYLKIKNYKIEQPDENI